MLKPNWKHLAAVAALPVASAVALADPPPRIKFIADDGKQQVIVLGEAGEAEGEGRGEYWLGLQLGELAPIVKEQLGLKGGLVVESVVEDSPTRLPLRTASSAGMLPPFGVATSTRWAIRLAPAQLTRWSGPGAAPPKRR